jgi:ribosomal-protein-alanine N-acetyltransferase|tara:strand:- start:508 stop:1029 length:522 start_codon:yes stop_codon:yes gene_type:complete
MTKSEVLILKKLNLKKDISKEYQNWLNDFEVQRYTEQKYKKHSLADVRNFVREKNKSKNEFLYGIFLKKNNLNTHIGNIKLGPINFTHKSAQISYFIGEKELWGNGYTTLAIKEIIKIAKKKGVKKLKAGLYEPNIGSEKVLIKNGFKIEGKFKSEIIYKGKRFNLHWFGKIL